MEKGTIRNVAKAGMVVSLAGLVWTALGKGRRYKCFHTWAGIALVGFSVWHYNAYQPADNRKP